MCLLRKADNFLPSNEVIFSLFKNTSPRSALSRVPIICNNVLLPAPEEPTILTISPCLIAMSTPFNTSTVPYFLWMLFAERNNHEYFTPNQISVNNTVQAKG
jgi:hypothetical protein